MKFLNVAILYIDGKSADVAEIKDTVKNLSNALLSKGHQLNIIKVNKNNWKQSIKTEADVFFNLVEDENWILYKNVAYGLEKLHKAQVGHSKEVLSFAIDKKIMKKKMMEFGISTPKYRIFKCGEKYLHHIRILEYPLMVKLSGQHAAIGISQDSVVIDENEADERIKYLYKNYKDDVLVEEFIDGRELTVTVVGNGKKALVLPIAELEFGGEYNNNWPIYSFNAKWMEGTWEYKNVKVVSPAKLDKKLKLRCVQLAKKAFVKLQMVDVVRMDMRVDERSEKVFIVDINASPSLSSNEYEGTYSAAKAYGWSYAELIDFIVRSTFLRKAKTA